METIQTNEQELIKAKINALKVAGELIPGIKIIQRTLPVENLFICKLGLKKFGLTEKFFSHLPNYEYRRIIFDPKDPNTCLLERTSAIGSDLSTKELYLRYNQHQENQEVELITVHHFLPDSNGKTQYSFTQILPLGLQSWAISKIKRIAQEVTFRKKNQKKFAQLTERNKEVLSHICRCLKAKEIAEKLCIGANTVNSHKKRIKEILETNETSDLILYGFAFDLI
ncbi:helix-turn-helix transcriptional regulator [uncultured Cyclobacterium sp.]|uniref:helix-turn-helix transcriptional regulator n=1 Tax=uncultured Cyclobacterium sp. TaxID=453820 RepID=UPI0030ED82FB|tara:strand:+ start:305 stop:982 length:678 start_codon:yes stop_codon:yes gene_type:complete